MIKTLRRKFILIAMSSIFVVLAVIMGVMNIWNYRRVLEHADFLTAYLAENGGSFDVHFRDESPGQKHMDKPDRDFTKETPFTTRFFTVTLDADGNAAAVDMRNVAAVSKSEAIQYAKAVCGKEKELGFQGVYRYRNAGNMVIFVDCRQELDSFQHQVFVSVSVSVGGLLAVFVLVLLFSRIVFRPVEESVEKQKGFITDASHEIKTPLTIIDANVEVIEMTAGESQWTRSTRHQIQRLTELTRRLVALSRLDEKGTEMECEEFCISEVVAETVQPFEAVAKADGKKICLLLEEGVFMSGDEQSIRQMMEILMDNAMKYSLAGTEIEVSLKRSGRKVQIVVSNQAEGFPQENMNRLFERFYRLDRSRNSATGGSGIGLSIAHAIVQSHKGRITAVSPDGKRLVITVEFRIKGEK